MKGLACGKCTCLRTLPRGNHIIVATCDCKTVAGWWEDGYAGVARYATTDRNVAQGVGFNNHFLTPAFHRHEATKPWGGEEWRLLHDHATNAPGFLFDKSRHDCWVVFFTPGTVKDVTWATWEECAAVGLPDEYRNYMAAQGMIPLPLPPEPVGAEPVDPFGEGS